MWLLGAKDSFREVHTNLWILCCVYRCSSSPQWKRLVSVPIVSTTSGYFSLLEGLQREVECTTSHCSGERLWLRSIALLVSGGCSSTEPHPKSLSVFQFMQNSRFNYRKTEGLWNRSLNLRVTPGIFKTWEAAKKSPTPTEDPVCLEEDKLCISLDRSL